MIRFFFKVIRRFFFLILLLLVLWLIFARGPKVEENDVPPVPPVPPDRVSIDPNAPADEVFVDKSERKLWLKSRGLVLKEYEIALGFSPAGHKEKQGDGKTPIGDYEIDWRNPQSQFYRSLHVSYPTAEQVQSARAKGIDPGGMIMIHGQPNGSEFTGDRKIKADWTNGCISVSNNEMDEIWARVSNGTKITIIE